MTSLIHSITIAVKYYSSKPKMVLFIWWSFNEMQTLRSLSNLYTDFYMTLVFGISDR